MNAFIGNDHYQLEYFKYGEGEKILFAFHGYNNHASYFSDLRSVVGKEYTIVSINIFFHGESKASDELVERGLNKNDLDEIFRGLMQKFPCEKYSLFAFSLGGRLAMKMTELFPGKIERLILLAPDGLRKTPLYWSLTQNAAGRSLFKKFVYNPELFFKVAAWLKKSGRVSENKVAFALYHFDSEWKRKRVYNVWLLLRNVHTSMSVLRKLIRKHRIRTYLFFGEYDRIIPSSAGFRMKKGMEDLIFLRMLKSGHRLLTYDNLRMISRDLRK